MEKVLVIVGPTAVGKTALSIKIAKEFNGEVINGDSVQVYKELDIGSAKITKEEMEGVPHHLLDIIEPGEDFSVASFQSLVREKIHEINSRGKLPIIVGGTGLYIQAVLYDFKFESVGRSEDFNKKYEQLSNEDLHKILQNVDKISSEKIHPNNRRRVLRALEIYENTNKSKSQGIHEQKKEPLYDFSIIGLNLPREILYERINKRVDIMINNGLLDEVENLYKKGRLINAIGYREFNDFFSHEKTLEEVKEDIKKNTRHYAKRQLTYFKNKLNVNWFAVNLNHYEETIKEVSLSVSNWLNEIN